MRQELLEQDLQALIITDILNVRYLSGFTGSSAVLIISSDEALLLTDSRYHEQSSQECAYFAVQLVQKHWMHTTASVAADLNFHRIGFESHSLTFDTWLKLSKLLTGLQLVPIDDLPSKLRTIKDEYEISAIREAVRITDLACEHIISVLKPGMSECEVALEIDCFMRGHGAEKEGFDTIVVSGFRSALPHGKPTDKIISVGEFITMDFGARWRGYHGDITRTTLIGTPDSKQVEVYNTVLEAQMRAVSAVRPAVRGGDVDAVARDYITSKGYGEYFGHGLGHDLGLAVHDGTALRRNSDIVLQPGMVVTVEPGIYIPDWGGVRIEDDVLVTETGCEVLTKCSKAMQP